VENRVQVPYTGSGRAQRRAMGEYRPMAARAESDPPAPAGAPAAASAHAFRWYVAGVGSWFASMGMQSVLFSWLIVGELRASPEWVGIVQTTSMLPSLLLLLVGGAAAERRDPRSLLMRLHVLAALPPLALAGAVAAGQLSIPLLIAFGVTMGTLSAFVMPARDTLLSSVAGEDMMHAVAGMTAAQFAAQALGALAAGAARIAGSAPMLAVQAGLLLLGSAAMRGVPEAPPAKRSTPPVNAWREITAGLPVMARNPQLRWPFVLVVCVGLFFIGPFVVCFPLLVRDVYGGDAGMLALVMMVFPIGTIVGSLLIRARGGIRRKGAGALVALALGAISLATIGFGLPFPGMLAAALAWGLCGSVFINCSRTLYQEAAPVAERARVLSTYQLGFVGAGPFGATLAGFLAGQVGLLATLQVVAGAMLCVLAAVAIFTETRRME
jgi:MFS family permease